MTQVVLYHHVQGLTEGVRSLTWRRVIHQLQLVRCRGFISSRSLDEYVQSTSLVGFRKGPRCFGHVGQV